MKLSGAKILLECLREQGVDTVFGYPGGTILNVYDALCDYTETIRHILTSHEQGAAHAADGYARSSGKVGVCFATSGPGATNLVTGIATAHIDSSPVVFITCNVSEELIGKDSFQEVDIVGISMPITKCSYLVRDVDSLADIVREAFAVARGGRPGPVLIDIVRNVTVAEADYTPLPREDHAANGRLGALIRRASHDLRAPEPDSVDIDRLVEMVAQAQRPLVICGGGVVRSRAQDEFKAFVEKIDSPVAITVMGCGGFPGRNPLTTGMIGMHGTQASNLASEQCDLLIAVGCRFSDRVGIRFDCFAQNAKVVQIDIDRSEINKNVQTDHHIVGDAKQVLALLNKKVSKAEHSEWKGQVFSWSTETEYEDVPGTLTPKEVMSAIARILPERTIVSTDVGQHQMWALQHFRFCYPGQLLTSGGFGTMGFGLGAAMGAKAANPEQVVLHVTGDGSFRMNCNELSTVEHYGLPVITCILNNKTLGMVRQWQSLIYDKRHSQTDLYRGPDFIKLAEAYQLGGKRVTTLPELEEALSEALAFGKGYVIDCAIDSDEMVRPMVRAGTQITQFLLD
ncbi:MAG: biosynthetic-type acetolactate synthase large subunit [Oscillospiraceae bacterium]|nr:biosynthetic-type acetolactate synthase large subunit [Oscillospiraceae bacterium]